MARYDEILAGQPQTRRWRAQGQLLPHRDDAHELVISTGQAAHIFDIFVNGRPDGFATANGEGDAVFSVRLVLGDNEVMLVDRSGGRTYRSYVTTRHLATLVAAAAEQIEIVDTDLNSLSAARSIDTVDNEYIEAVYGQLVEQGNGLNFDLEAYRSLLNALRGAYRHLAGVEGGLQAVIAAFLSTAPFVVPHAWLPSWYLGLSLIPNGNFRTRARSSTVLYDAAGIDLPNLNGDSSIAVHALFEGNDPSNDFPGPIIQPRITVHAALVGNAASNIFPGPFFLPQSPQVARVTFAANWTGGNVTLTGVDAAGDTVSETFNAAPGMTLVGQRVFVTFTGAVKSLVGTSADTVLVEVADPQRLTVLFNALWDGGDVTVYGLSPGGEDISEVFDGSVAPEHVTGTVVFHTITAITKDVVGANVAEAGVGLAVSRFVRVIDIGPYNEPGTSTQLKLLTGPSRLVWGAAAATPPATATDITVSGVYVLTDLERASFLIGRDTSATFDTRSTVIAGRRVLRLNVDNLGLLDVQLSEAVATSRATVVADINAALVADPRYGASYATFANVMSAAVVRLRDPTAPLTYGGNSRIEVHANACDVATTVLGIPRARATTTAVTIAQGATAIPCVDTGLLPATPEAYQIRLGRGPVANGVGLIISSPAGLEADIDLTGFSGWDLYSAGGFVRVTGTSFIANRGLHPIISATDGSSVVRILNVNNTGFVGDTDAGASWVVWAMGEVVTVTENDRTTDILTLAAPGTVITHPVSVLAELLEETPVAVTGQPGLGTLTVEVDQVWNPGLTPSDFVLFAGSTLPDGWIPGGTPIINAVEAGAMDVDRIRVEADGGNDPSIRIPIPRGLEYRGWMLRATAWVQQNAATTRNVRIDYSTNGGVSFTLGAPTAVPATVFDAVYGHGPLTPIAVTQDFDVPTDASGVQIRLFYDASANGDSLLIEQVALVAIANPGAAPEDQAPVTGFYLGSGTIPRTPQGLFQREVLYVWPLIEPESALRDALGIPTSGSQPANYNGHIDGITPVHELWERFDVSEYTTGDSTNVRGAYDDAGWAAATLTNLAVTVNSPPYKVAVVPTTISRVTERLVTEAPSDAFLANLSTNEGSYPQDPGLNDFLVEVDTEDTTGFSEGSPLLPSEWHWEAGDHVRIDVGFDATATYDLQYDILMQAETAIIDLGVTYAEFLWIADLAAFYRREVHLLSGPRTEQLAFRGDFTAALEERSTGSKVDAVLIKDDGVLQTTLSSEDWEYVDNGTVRLLATSLFDANAVFSLTYTALTPDLDRVARIRLEWRGATTSVAVTAQTYVEIAPNVGVDRTLRYHQLRATVYGVVDVRDTRIEGLGLKGIHTGGATPSAPGIVVPHTT